MSNNNTEQKIREMAKLSLLSDKINDVQEKNLKMFPLIFFNDIESVKIEYDLSTTKLVDTEENKENLEINYKLNNSDTKHFKVSYHLRIKDMRTNGNLDKRYKAIEESVRNLFWKEVRVQVFINDNLEYES